jgi:hypothetical protein
MSVLERYYTRKIADRLSTLKGVTWVDNRSRKDRRMAKSPAILFKIRDVFAFSPT